MPTIYSTTGPDTPNVGRVIWNTNDGALKTEVEAATADIATHKGATNADHDTHNNGRYSVLAHTHDDRYYTETEIDAKVVDLTTAQTVAGVKSLTSNPVIKNAAPGVELQTAAAAPVGKLLGAAVGVTDNIVRLQGYNVQTAQYQDIIRGYPVDGSADSDLDLYSKGKILATREYVDMRVRSGTYAVHMSQKIASLAASTTYWFVNPGAGSELILPPAGARISKLIFALTLAASPVPVVISEQIVNLTMPITPNQFLAPSISTGADSSGVVYTFVLWQGQVGGIIAVPWSIDSATLGLAKLATGIAVQIDITIIVSY
jgi:hypothetical protein